MIAVALRIANVVVLRFEVAKQGVEVLAAVVLLNLSLPLPMPLSFRSLSR